MIVGHLKDHDGGTKVIGIRIGTMWQSALFPFLPLPPFPLTEPDPQVAGSVPWFVFEFTIELADDEVNGFLLLESMISRIL